MTSRRRTRFVSLLFALSLIVSLAASTAQPAQAISSLTCYWLDGANGLWQTSAWWNCGGGYGGPVPGQGDYALFGWKGYATGGGGDVTWGALYVSPSVGLGSFNKINLNGPNSTWPNVPTSNMVYGSVGGIIVLNQPANGYPVQSLNSQFSGYQTTVNIDGRADAGVTGRFWQITVNGTGHASGAIDTYWLDINTGGQFTLADTNLVLAPPGPYGIHLYAGGTLNLSNVTLRNRTPGGYWYLWNNGTPNFSKVDIQDCYVQGNILDLRGTGSIDSGHNYNILFDARLTGVSVPGGTYVAGQTLTFTTNWDQAVTVTGQPRLPIVIGSTTRYATYASGSGTTAQTYTYTVQVGDQTATGITLGTQFDLNSGTLKDVSGTAVPLTLSNLTGTALVDTVPTLVVSSAPNPSQVLAGVTVTATATTLSGAKPAGTVSFYADGASFATGVSLDGSGLAATTISSLSAGTHPITATYGGSASYTPSTSAVITQTVNKLASTTTLAVSAASGTVGQALTFTGTVSGSGPTPTGNVTLNDGATVLSAPALNGSGQTIYRTLMAAGTHTVTAAYGGDPTYNASTSANVLYSTTPAAQSVSVPAPKTYIAGQNLDFTVNWTEPVSVTGTPRLPLTLDSGTVYAGYVSGSGTSALVFRHTVGGGDNDADGLAVGALDLTSGSLKSKAGGVSVAPNLNNVGATTYVRVDTTAPTVISVTVPADSIYGSGQTLDFSVKWSEPVTRTGAPQLALTVGAATCYATYQGGMGTDTLQFRYIVGSGDKSAPNISVNAVDLSGGGTLQDLPGNTADLTLHSVGSTTNVIVNGESPYVTSVAVPGSGPWGIGQALDFTVNWNKAVTVLGMPLLPITVGGTVYSATYQSGSGTAAILFSVVVPEGASATGITLSSLALNSGALYDALNNAASLTLNGVPSTSGIAVDGVRPAVLSVDGPLTGTTFVADDVFTYTVYWDQAVTVTGAPAIAITVGVNPREADFVSGSGTTTLVFTYTLQSGDDTSGDIPVDNALQLKGSAVADDAGNAANLTLANVSGGKSVLVDTTLPTITSVQVPPAGRYQAGQNLEFTVNWSEAVAVSNTPRLALTIGGITGYADYQSGSGTPALKFAYTLVDGDTDGLAVVSPLDLNDGTLKDTAGNDATLALASVGDTTGVWVDTHAPTVGSIVRLTSTPTNLSNVQFVVTFSEPVTGLDPSRFTAAQSGGLSGAVVTTLAGAGDTYTVTVGGYSGSGTLGLNRTGAGIADLADNALAASAKDISGQTIAVDADPPVISSVDVPVSNTYTFGQVLTFSLNWSEPVTITGQPRLALGIGPLTRYANYVSGSGTAVLVFTYTVPLDDQAKGGISVAVLELNSGTLQDAASNSALLTLNSVGDTSQLNVQGTFALNLTVVGSGGGDVTVEPDGVTPMNYLAGTVVTLTPSPDGQSLFAGWSGSLYSMVHPLNLTMDSDKDLVGDIELQGAAYVDPSYGPTTPGWGVTRFASLQTAIASGSATDIHVHAGEYTESVNATSFVNLIFDAGVTIAGNLTLSQGTVDATAGGLTVTGNLSLSGSAAFDATGSTLSLGGNFSLNASGGSAVFTATGSTVVFTGNNPSITGAAAFDNLTMSGTGTLTTSVPVSVTGDLVITSGAFSPASGSSFKNITVDSGATLDLPTDGTVFISGDFTNNGTVQANDAIVVFNGAGPQTIGGTHPTTFASLVGSGGAILATNPLTVTQGLTLTSGTFTPTADAVFGNLDIQAGAAFNMQTGTTVTHDLTNAGTFTQTGGSLVLGGDLVSTGAFDQTGGAVVFNGSGAQAISGDLTFADLVMSGSGTLTPASPITITGGLTVTTGVFAASDDSHFHNVTIGSGGRLSLPSGGGVSMSGDWTNNGTVNANGSTVVFGGAGPQFIAGTAPTKFDSVIASGGVVSATTAMTVTNALTVTSGTFDPANGSLFNTVNIGVGGTFTLTAGETIAISSDLTNRGHFTPTGGTVNLSGDLVNSGTFAPTGGTVNLGGNLTNAGTFAPTGGTVVFNGANAQAITGSVNFANLVVSQAVTSADPIVVSQALTVTAGGSLTPSPGSSFGTITIDPSGILTLPAGGGVSVSGDFTNNGTFQANGGTLTFDGAGPQAIGGTTRTTFDNLALNGAGPLSTSNPITVTRGLTVTQGTFTPDSGSAFADIFIDANGTLDLPADGTITVGGDFTNDGTFYANGATVTFDGTGAQGIGGIVPTSFDHLVLNGAGPLSTSSPITVTSGLTVTQGTFTPTSGSAFGNVFIDTNGTLNLPTDGTVTVAGNFINDGAFHANGGTIAFDGSGAQAILGTTRTTFDNLVLNGAGPLSTPRPITVTNGLTVTQGAFAPASGSAFNNIFIDANGTLELPTDGTITVGGDFTNDGTFNANGATVTFDGSGAQAIGGAAPTAFDNLVIDGTGMLTTTSPITVTNGLTVTQGTFTPASGSAFGNVSIGANGTLDLPADRTVTLGGDFTNDGTFNANSSTVTFDGSGAQAIGGTTPTTFDNLVLNGAGPLTAANPITVTQRLTLTNGTFTPATGSSFADITLGAGGTLDLLTNGAISVSGDFTNDGTFNANGATVTFDGNGTQTIGGATPTAFDNLVLDGTGPLTGPLSVTQSLTVTHGIIDPASGSVFNAVNVLTGGGFTLQASEIVTITGDLTNAGNFAPAGGTLHLGGNVTTTGTFAATGGTLLFDGSGASQSIIGPATFANLTASQGLSASDPLTVTQALSITTGGDFTPASGSTFNDVLIGTGGTLNLPTNGSISVGGDFTNDGTFNPNGGTVIFDGSGAQAINGATPTSFDNLVLDGAGPLNLASPITVTQGLTLTNGTFNPASGSALNDVTISAGSTLDLPTDGIITVGGDFTNDGTFHANGGTVTFDGTADPQTIGGTTSTSFDNLVFNGFGPFSSSTPITVTNGLTVTQGAFTPASGSAFNDIFIDANGTLELPTDGTITVGGDFTNDGTFNANGATVTFDGSGAQAIGGTTPTTFDNLVLNGTGQLSAPNPITVTQGLTLTNGDLNLASGSQIHDLATASGTTLTVTGSGDLTISGNVVNDGAFLPGPGTVIFDGTAGPQTLGGTTPIIFADVILSNTLSASNPITVTNGLTVANGTFDPASGSLFNTMDIQPGGTFTLQAGESVTLTGDLTNAGTFAPADGTIHLGGNLTNTGDFTPGGVTLVFDGTNGPQTITGPVTFANLVASNAIAATDPLTVTQGLTVTAGIDFAPPSGSDFHDVTVDPGAALTLPPGSTLAISGDFTDLGVFNPGTGTVVFDGSGAQAITGTFPITFTNLVLDGTGPLTTGGPISVTDGLTVTTGTFAPADGSSFQDITIDSGATLIAPPGGTINIGGDLTNDGTFTPSVSTVVFNGGGTQVITGTVPLSLTDVIVTGGTTLLAGVPITVSNGLTITSGIFEPLPGTVLNDVYVAPGATLTLPPGPGIVITGDLVNLGQTNLRRLLISLAGDGQGQVLVTPAGNAFASGTVILLTAIPNRSGFTGWSGDLTSRVPTQVITLTTDEIITATFSAIKIYLPFIRGNGTPPVQAPDLIIQRVIATPNTIQVVIKNQGTAAVTNEFWVEAYIQPATAPTHVNQSWPMLSHQGLTWGVTAVALPQLTAGGVMTLTFNDSYYVSAYSQVSWPLALDTPVYAQVDSVNHATTYGAVLETHEISAGAYNNILGPVSVAASNMLPLAAQPITHLPGDGFTLPAR